MSFLDGMIVGDTIKQLKPEALMRISLLFLLAACTTTAKYEAYLDEFKGQSVDKVIMDWGAPENISTMPNAMTVYQYLLVEGASITMSHNNQMATEDVKTYKHYCKVQFIVAEKKVLSWHHDGDNCKLINKVKRVEIPVVPVSA